jgi:hypothetical protein
MPAGPSTSAFCSSQLDAWICVNPNSYSNKGTADTLINCYRNHIPNSCTDRLGDVEFYDSRAASEKDEQEKSGYQAMAMGVRQQIIDCFIAAEKSQPTEASREEPGDEVVQACVDKAAKALEDCDMSENSEYKDLMNAADQAAKSFQNASQSSIVGACGSVAKISQAANGFLATYKVTCSTSVNACQSACSEAETSVKARTPANPDAENRVKAAKADCSKSSSRLSGVDGQIAGIVQTQANSSQCAKLTAQGDALPSMPTIAQCRQNPALAGCATVLGVDCLNPSVASSNLVCVCQKKPNDSRCTGLSVSGLPNVGAGLDGTASAKIDTSGFGSPNFDSGSNSGDAPAFFNGEESLSSGLPKMVAGGSAGLSGQKGINEASKKGGKGKPTGNFDTNVYGGYRGGGGPMGPGRPGQSAQPGAAANAAKNGLNNGKGNSVDYTKFLPKQNEWGPRRAVASGYPDGITGPFSDNFKKVNEQFQRQRLSLLP